MNIFAFAQITDENSREKVFSELKNGVSRFGNWDQKQSLNEKWYGKHQKLLNIKEGDWIVHINMPCYGQCTAAKVEKAYHWDSGISTDYGVDFNNNFKVQKDSLITFNRRDPNVVPSVNLSPRRRIQEIHQKEDFLISLENLKSNKLNDIKLKDRGVTHLKEKTEKILTQLTQEIQRMNRSKELELLLHQVFERVPNCTSVTNGFGWKTDHGADLLVDFDNPLLGINLSHKLVVQVKSYTDSITDRNAIDQILEGIKVYEADGGLLFTTATMTEELESYIIEISEKYKTSIDVIAGNDVAKFILRYAPDLILGNA